ncbi:MAG TPA: hypothetical protein PKJ37_02945 [Acidobacteriota bacterium]|nr:hypothetical protein [Acidobacteriota bacterium]HNT16839.1 hypothetical protein [Acidobacteriota bacterium]
MPNDSQLKKKKYFLNCSLVCLLAGHLFSIVAIIKLVRATLWGLKHKDHFFTCFLSYMGSDLLSGETLMDGSIQIKRVGPNPIVGLIILLAIPIAFYLVWFLLRRMGLQYKEPE